MAATTVISNEEWEEQRPDITKLYGEQEWPLKQVIKQLRSKDFNPTEAQVRSKLKKWKVIKPHRQSRKKHSLGSEGKPTSKSRFPTRPDLLLEGDEDTPSSSRESPESDPALGQDLQNASTNWTTPGPWSTSSNPQSTPIPAYNFNSPVEPWHGSPFAAQGQSGHHYPSVGIRADGVPSSSPGPAFHPPMSVWSPSQSTWAPSAESSLSPFTDPAPSLLPYADSAGSFQRWETSNVETSHSHVYPQQSQPLENFGFALKAPLHGNVPSYSHRPRTLIDLSYSHAPQFSPVPPQNQLAASPSSELDLWPAGNLSQAKHQIRCHTSNKISKQTEERARVSRAPRLRHSSLPNDRKLSNDDVKAVAHRYEGIRASAPVAHAGPQVPPSQELANGDLPQDPYLANFNYPTVVQAQLQTQPYQAWPQMHGSPAPLPQAQSYDEHLPIMYS